MKKIGVIAGLVALTSVSAFAATTKSANVYGILRVDSSAAETIVAIPWVATSSGSESPITVCDIVKTANLNPGDMLYAYLNGSFSAWQLQTDSTSGLLKWMPATNVTANKVAVSSASASQTLARGNAILLERHAPIANCFYIYGQVGRSSPSTTLAAGSEQTAVFSLLAPPTDGDSNVNTCATGWDSSCVKDVIWVASPTFTDRYYYREVSSGVYKWCKMSYNPSTRTEEWSADAATIPAGQGAWYERHGASELTISWQNVPSVN